MRARTSLADRGPPDHHPLLPAEGEDGTISIDDQFVAFNTNVLTVHSKLYQVAVDAPRFDGAKLEKPLFVTLLFNGILAHNHRALTGTTEHRVVGTYRPHGDGPLLLQDHGARVRYRNVWVRRLTFPE